MYEKVNPYLRPLYDALYDMLDMERATRLIERGFIEIAPLAFMRGRTLNDAFVILDEAQNTGTEQMKMFLTRLGFSSKAVVTGDVTQIDLPDRKASGLVEVQHILKGIKGIKFVYFSKTDVVRHPLVQKIIRAYETKKGDLEGQQVQNGNKKPPSCLKNYSTLIIILIFSMTLAFLIVARYPQRFTEYHIGDIAHKNIKAPFDVVLPDDNTTIKKGEVIVREGERITKEHLEGLSVIKGVIDRPHHGFIRFVLIFPSLFLFILTLIEFSYKI
jgi:hypothetical protein